MRIVAKSHCPLFFFLSDLPSPGFVALISILVTHDPGNSRLPLIISFRIANVARHTLSLFLEHLIVPALCSLFLLCSPVSFVFLCFCHFPLCSYWYYRWYRISRRCDSKSSHWWFGLSWMASDLPHSHCHRCAFFRLCPAFGVSRRFSNHTTWEEESRSTIVIAC